MSDDRFQLIRLLEAMLFAATEPMPLVALEQRLPEGTDVPELLAELKQLYANRGVHLVQHDERWCFRTAPDLADRLSIETKVTRKLSRAAIETLAIVAYHQPVTRGEIEEIRGVIISQGTLDRLPEIGWIKPKGRRQTPGRPVTWVTTDSFLEHFGLESLDALPGIEELRATGLLDARPAISTLGAQVMSSLSSGAGNSGTEADEEAEDREDEDADDASEAPLDHGDEDEEGTLAAEAGTGRAVMAPGAEPVRADPDEDLDDLS